MGRLGGGGFEELLEDLVRRAVREELDQVLAVVREQLAAATRPTPRSYTIDDAAEVLDLSSRTVRRLVDSSELRSVRVGTRVLIPADAIDSYLEKLSPTGTEP
jgi:excisionase family DNA binding protein